MGQVSLYRFKSTPFEENFEAPPDRKILDPYPSGDMVPPVYRIGILEYFCGIMKSSIFRHPEIEFYVSLPQPGLDELLLHRIN